MEVKSNYARLTAESLEMKLFPEEFCASDKDENSSGQSSGTDGEALSEAVADEGTSCVDDLDASDPSSLEKPNVVLEKLQGITSLAASSKWSQKRKGAAVRGVPTPAKARKSKGTAESSRASVTKTAQGRCRKDRGLASSDEEGGTLDENAVFDELFGSEIESEDADMDTAAFQHAIEAEAVRAEAPRMVLAQKRRREDVAKVPVAEPTERVASGGVSRGEPRSPSDDSGDHTTWTYEVIGNKLGIRKVPDTQNAPSTGYLAPGEFFKVTEQVAGEDGRTYLRLADGRGWAYDRSAKDIKKVVVRLIKTQ